MPTSYTSLLGFALPVTGELQGTWGTTVNDSITELVEDSIAATATASVTSGNWTLSTSGSGVANEARCAILVPTGTPGVSRNIIAPSQSKAYIVINQSDAAVVVKGSATTGTTIAAGDRAVVAWNGSDFVTIASSAVDGGDVVGPASATDNAVVRFDGTTGKLVQNSGVLIADDGTTVISVNSSTDALRITQTGAGNALVVEDDTNPDSTPVVIDSVGSLIIGSTTAISGITNAIQVIGDGTSTTIGIARFQDTSAAANFVSRKARGSKASPTASQASDVVLDVIASAYDGSAFQNITSVRGVVEGIVGTNDISGRLEFRTRPSGSGGVNTERMRIDSAGNVGIGTAGDTLSRLTLGGTFTDSSGNTQGIRVAGTVPNTANASYYGFSHVLTTQAASFTVPNAGHFVADQGTIGAGSAITTQFGFRVSSTLTGATNNYGFYSDIASGTGRWNFYANGTAENFFGGVTTFRAANAVRVEAAATQDAVVIAGRAGGTGSFAITLTPATLSASRTLTLPEPGENVTLGYLNIPQNSQSTAYTLVATDAGKQIFHPSADTTARTYTIPANSSVAYPIGTAITFINQNGAGVITIAITTDTMRLAGAGTTGSRTLAANGIATCVKVTSTEWIISGTGLT